MERKRIEVLVETFIRKQLGLKAHTVTRVEETEEYMIIHIDRLGTRLLRCGLCRKRCRKVHSLGRPREWGDLSMRKLPWKLRYRPRRVECPRCGVRVEDFPWAEPWARVTTALSNAVAKLARELSWQGTARQYGLNWKSVATIVKRTVKYGLENRPRPPVHVIGIDEVSRRKGQVYLTVVYDLERRVLLWVGDDRTEEAVRPFFTSACHMYRRSHQSPPFSRHTRGRRNGSGNSSPSTSETGMRARRTTLTFALRAGFRPGRIIFGLPATRFSEKGLKRG